MIMKDEISRELVRARMYEAEHEAFVPAADRSVFHFSPRVGWLNDPNGLSYCDGLYHLFYQYHPYSTQWGPMHWGHAVSRDLISWRYLPAALAPDHAYDQTGCFSGSACVTDDGRHLLIYTGCGDSSGDPTGKGRWLQTQNIAVRKPGEEEYVKYEGNPVITADDLPEGGDSYEFRDPYLWRTEDGSYRCLVANGRTSDELGTQLTVYASPDGLHWGGGKVLFEDKRKIGVMWECPNFFPLGGRYVLLASPMDMQAEEEEAVGSIRFPKGNNVCYIRGDYDTETEDFIPDADEDGKCIYAPVDRGLDFYAPQVMETPDGRQVMVGWMQDPKTAAQCNKTGQRIFGQMTVPRELSIRDGDLYQWPVRELEAYRQDPVRHRGLLSCEWESIPGICGRSADLLIRIRAQENCEKVGIRLAADSEHGTELRFDPLLCTLMIDRSGSGREADMNAVRTTRVRDRSGELDLRILIDKWSAEIFVNGGEQVMSATFYTDPAAQDIAFRSEGSALIDITKYMITDRQGR